MMLMLRTTRRGLEGDLAATRYVLDQVIGKPTPIADDPSPLRINLPLMRTVADCAAAVDLVTRAFTAGNLNATDAQLLNDLIATRMKALEGITQEQQIAELERQIEQLKAHRN